MKRIFAILGMVALTTTAVVAYSASAQAVTCNSTAAYLQSFEGNPEGFLWYNTSDGRAYLENSGKTPTMFCAVSVSGGAELVQNNNSRCLTSGAISAYLTGCNGGSNQVWNTNCYLDGSCQFIDNFYGDCLLAPHIIDATITKESCDSGEQNDQAWFFLHNN